MVVFGPQRLQMRVDHLLRKPRGGGGAAGTGPGDSVVAMTSTTSRYLLALAASVGTVLFLLFGIGALGIVGDGDRDAVYLAAPAVGLLVAAVTRFRPRGMVLALGAAAATTLVAGAVAIGLVATDRATASVPDVVMLTGMYAALFAAAAWLFTRVELPTRGSEAKPEQHIGRDIIEGLRWIRHNKPVRTLSLIIFIFNLTYIF